MALSKVSVTVTYSKPGTQPPVYVAGSFSEPPWQLQEMEYTTEANNEHQFHKNIIVNEGGRYQYKYRLGVGDWWVLNEDLPTVTDDGGNRNNLLEAPIAEKKVEALPTHPPVASSKSETSSIPAVVVEEVDAEPTKSGEVSSKAAVRQKDAHQLKAQDAEHDYVMVSGEVDSEEQAKIAAEVADSAAIIDREPSPMPISDEEAGRIGMRRMSSTPIPEVAKTAAEVADTAAIIDREPLMMETSEFYLPAEGDEGTITPIEERAPLFAHECVTPYEGKREESSHEPIEDSADPPAADEVIDENDPTIEEFPEDRLAILAQVRSTESRLNEDETVFEDVAASPVGVVRTHSDIGEAASSSQLDAQPSPALDKITEEEHEQEEPLELPPASNGISKAVGLDDIETSKSVTDVQSETPAITIHPAPPAVIKPMEAVKPSDPAPKDIDTAKSTSIETEKVNGNGTVKARTSPPTERPLSAASIRSSANDKSGKNFFAAIWDTIFIGWIGRLITRLCSLGRRPLLAVSALLLFIAPVWYFSSRVA